MGNQNSMHKSKEDRQLKLLKEKGVLIPPIFGTGLDRIPPPSSSTTSYSTNSNTNGSTNLQSLVFQWMESQEIYGNSPISIMKSTAPSLRLLQNENASIGFWLSASDNDTSSVATSITKQPSTSLFGGEMTAAQLFSIADSVKGGIGLKARSLGNNKIAGGGFVRHDPSGLGFFLSCADNLQGIATGWTLLTQFQNDNTQKQDISEDAGITLWLGSSMQFIPHALFSSENTNGKVNKVNLNRFKSLFSLGQDENFIVEETFFNTDSISNIRTWAAIKALNGAFKGAAETNYPMNQLIKNKTIQSILLKNTSYFLTYQFLYNDKNSFPPITLTMHNSPTKDLKTSTIFVLSQVINFDRFVINPIEERCPKIRNTLHWSMKIENQSNDNISTSNHSKASAAIAWQVNRSIAFKCQCKPNGTIALNFLWKKWEYPRVTLNLASSIDFHKKSNLFQGVGVQIETGSDFIVNYPNSGYILNRGDKENGANMKYEVLLDQWNKDNLANDNDGNSSSSSPPILF